jgi:hypothetical protein
MYANIKRYFRLRCGTVKTLEREKGGCRGSPKKKIDLFKNILDRLEDESDLQAIREAKKEPLYDQKDAEEYIYPVKLFTEDEPAPFNSSQKTSVAD